MRDTINRLRGLPSAHREQIDRAFTSFGTLWEQRLANGWEPPEGSPFPWAMVQRSLAALLPGFRTMRATERQGESPVIALVLAGNTPLLAWPALHSALSAGCTVFVKMSQGETLWPRLFRDALSEVDADLADRVQWDVWPGEDVRTTALLQSADAVVAYGSDTTLATLRRATPLETPFFGYGHALSIGIALADLSDFTSVTEFALDVLMYDQGGCLSPQAIFVEGGAERAEEAGGLLAGGLTAAVDRLGVAPVSDPAIALTIRQNRDLALFYGARLCGDAHLRWTVAIFPSSIPLESPPGHSFISVIPLQKAADDIGPLLGMARGRLSAVGVAGEIRDELREVLRDEGGSYLCRPGEMQTPPLDWPNDNRDLCEELLRFRRRKDC